MINPYIIYVLSFLAVLTAYLFNWSMLFPELGWPLLTFLFCSIMIAFALGRVLWKNNIITFNEINFTKKLYGITSLIILGYFAEFIYHRNFPLLAIFTKNPLPYNEFGIPTFHVILVTFNSFFAVYLFQVLITSLDKKMKVSALFILNLIPSLLILNRGMLVMILMSCLSVYLIKYQKQITLRKISAILVFLLLGLYIFGVAGNIRVNSSYNTNTSLFSNKLFLNIGGATDEFKESLIPKEFFWGYIYIASPLANLQENINEFEHKEDINVKDSVVFSVTQTLPDFISKRIASLYEFKVPSGKQIAPELNVSTAFAEPFVILGWVGISLYTLFIFIVALFYILLLKFLKSEYFVVGVAIMNTIFLFNTFTNMFAFTGLSFQLVYPLLFTLFSKRKFDPNL